MRHRLYLSGISSSNDCGVNFCQVFLFNSYVEYEPLCNDAETDKTQLSSEIM